MNRATTPNSVPINPKLTASCVLSSCQFITILHQGPLETISAILNGARGAPPLSPLSGDRVGRITISSLHPQPLTYLHLQAAGHPAWVTCRRWYGSCPSTPTSACRKAPRTAPAPAPPSR